ncbi:MAG: N(4)-(beta-N-acetylglucosaminyl)-L-asparaginase [Planctomycetota bacterium]
MVGLSRRSFLRLSAAASAAGALPACGAARPFRRSRSPVAVSSRNGRKAVEIAVAKMLEGWRPVDAAVKGVEVVENDPDDMSVGLGGLPNEEGVVELDACCMDGPSGLAGAVAALRNIKNPAQVALKVMRHTDHVLLVGEGALRFAKSYGFPEENLLTEKARKIWVEWRERRSANDDWIPADANGEHGHEWLDQFKDHTGTIHLGAVDANGDCGSCTTTSGLAFKVPGRVGDSPLIGCGNYCDNDVGCAGSTGRGEAAIVTNGASFIVGQMAAGKSPTDACLEACRRVVRFTKVKRLLDGEGRPNFQIQFYAVSKSGQFGAASLYASSYAVCDGDGPRVLDTASLYEKRLSDR